MKRQYLYVYVCRKPSGWGRHFGYSGVTNAPRLRDLQHKAKQPWYPLVIKRHVIPLGRVPRFVAIGLEYLLIKVTMPVYNVQHNRTNPRAIPPSRARAQRINRDRYGFRPARARSFATALPVLALVIAAVVLWSR